MNNLDYFPKISYLVGLVLRYSGEGRRRAGTAVKAQFRQTINCAAPPRRGSAKAYTLVLPRALLLARSSANPTPLSIPDSLPQQRLHTGAKLLQLIKARQMSAVDYVEYLTSSS